MSVLLDLGIFPMDQGASVGAFVAPVVAMIRASGHPYQLGAMGTLVETEDLESALALIARAHQVLAAQGLQAGLCHGQAGYAGWPLGATRRQGGAG